jgi:hypothetical protein
LNSSETEKDARVGFDEVAEKAEREVGDHEEFECVTGQEGAVVGAGILRLRRGFASRGLCSAQDDNFVKDGYQDQEEDDFVELGGMARDAIAEVDGPGEIGGNAIGVVGESGEEAADAADGDAAGEWDGVEIAGGVVDADVALEEFNGDQAEDQGADYGFSSHEVGGVAEALPGELRVFQPVKKSGAESASGNGGGDDGPTDGSRDGIAEAAAQCEVDAEGNDVGESFEEEVRVDAVRAYRDIDGKLRGEME